MHISRFQLSFTWHYSTKSIPFLTTSLQLLTLVFASRALKSCSFKTHIDEYIFFYPDHLHFGPGVLHKINTHTHKHMQAHTHRHSQLNSLFFVSPSCQRLFQHIIGLGLQTICKEEKRIEAYECTV